jgi:hypothetical protein
VGAGVFLLVLGAILMFAVRGDTRVVDIQTVGLILAVAGAVIVWQARKGASRERQVTVVDDLSDPAKPVRTVHETVTEQDPFEHLQGVAPADPVAAPELHPRPREEAHEQPREDAEPRLP